jgi:YggT family protein
VIFIRYFIVFLVRILNYAILARVLVSWLPISRDNVLVAIIYEITEPIIAPIREVLPSMGGLDLSPMIALILLQVAQRVVLSLFV